MDVVADITLVVESEKGLFRVRAVALLSSKVSSLSRENLGTVDHTVPMYRIVTSIIDFDTYSHLSLVRIRLLKTTTRGEEHMRHNVYN